MGGPERLATDLLWAEQVRMVCAKRAEKVLSTITYKPEWVIRITYDWFVEIRTPPLKDVTGGDKPIFGIYLMDPTPFFDGHWDQGEEYFVIELWRNIRDLEDHEMKEWFRVNGKAIYLDERDEERFHGKTKTG